MERKIQIIYLRAIPEATTARLSSGYPRRGPQLFLIEKYEELTVTEATEKPFGPLPQEGKRERPMGRTSINAFAVAIGAIALAAVGRLLLAPWLNDELPFLFFVLPVAIAARTGGLAPALLATALGLALGLTFVTIFAPLSITLLVEGLVFTAIGLVMAFIGEQSRQDHERAIASTRDALAREAHVKSILETVPEAMIVIDENGVVQSFSAAAERQFGYAPSEVLARNVKILMPSPYREDHDESSR